MDHAEEQKSNASTKLANCFIFIEISLSSIPMPINNCNLGGANGTKSELTPF